MQQILWLIWTPLVTIAAVTITNSRRRVLLHLVPNSFPATRYTARREIGDESPIEYIQVNRERRLYRGGKCLGFWGGINTSS